MKTVLSKTCNVLDLTKPLVVTYDNTLGIDKACAFFVQTLDTNAWEYAVISIRDTYKDHRDKLLGYCEYLKTLPADKIVVLSDSRDVICVRHVKAFMEGYKSLQSDFVVSMELFCNETTDLKYERDIACVPLVKYWEHHKIHSLPLRKYVNSGLIVGKASALLAFLLFSISNDIVDDQEALGIYMNMFPAKVYADYEATLLHSTTFGKSGGLENGLIQKHDSPTFAEFLGRAAFFLHFPALNTKGQKLMYQMSKNIVDQGICSKTLNDLYGIGEWDWSQRPTK
jgi:hypothetical protein